MQETDLVLFLFAINGSTFYSSFSPPSLRSPPSSPTQPHCLLHHPLPPTPYHRCRLIPSQSLCPYTTSFLHPLPSLLSPPSHSPLPHPYFPLPSPPFIPDHRCRLPIHPLPTSIAPSTTTFFYPLPSLLSPLSPSPLTHPRCPLQHPLPSPPPYLPFSPSPLTFALSSPSPSGSVADMSSWVLYHGHITDLA